jgi:hypothetical protein
MGHNGPYTMDHNTMGHNGPYTMGHNGPYTMGPSYTIRLVCRMKPSYTMRLECRVPPVVVVDEESVESRSGSA